MKGIRRAGACPARAAANAGKRGVFLLIALTAVPLSLAPPPLALDHPSAQTVPAANEDVKTGNKPSVSPTLAAITRAFRTQKPEPLRDILPKEGKVFISLRSIGNEAGYYGRDQVHFIFAKIFQAAGHVRFQLTEREVRTSGSRKSTAHCVGLWTYKNKEGNEASCQLFFVLILKNDIWSLVQIREAL